MARKRKKLKLNQLPDKILEHLAKTIDNMTFKELIEVIPHIFCMLYGIIAFKDVNPALGAAIGLTGYELATSDNEAAGIAGVATLAGMGIVSISWDRLRQQQGQIQAIKDNPNMTDEEKRLAILALIREWQT